MLQGMQSMQDVHKNDIMYVIRKCVTKGLQYRSMSKGI